MTTYLRLNTLEGPVEWRICVSSSTLSYVEIAELTNRKVTIRGVDITFGRELRNDAADGFINVYFDGSWPANTRCESFDRTTPYSFAREYVGFAFDSANKVLWAADKENGKAYEFEVFFADLRIRPVFSSPIDVLPSASLLVSGCAFLNGHLYVCYSNSNRIRAYNTATRTRDETLDIVGVTATGFQDLATDGVTLYALDSLGEVRVIDVTNKSESVGASFTVPGTGEIRGFTLFGATTYVLKLLPTAGTAFTSVLIVYTNKAKTVLIRPEETATERYEGLVEEASGADVEARSSDVTLPERDVSGFVQEALRRCEESEGGRAIGGVLYPRGTWRKNLYNNKPSVLGKGRPNAAIALTGENMRVNPVAYAVDTLIVNQVIATIWNGTEYRQGDSDSAALYGKKLLRQAFDTSLEDTKKRVTEMLTRYSQPYTIVYVEIETLQEVSTLALQALGAAPHTPVWIGISGIGSKDQIVLWRKIRFRNLGDDGLTARIELKLVDPELFGIEAT